ncbi:MAG: 2-oxoglutarate dehydrogenase complex dihydrolipoyllysine-residue succinyltransferase [Proteobacteria bacterium]|nr:2-oxoglutarate dehydrogenase complex dihydrolipoyllysine-residue succinyltransferase [Pseudomonadota bacterium]
MPVEIKIPEVGESIREVILAEWYKKEGDYVKTDETVLVIETDKVTLEIPAEAGGILHILIQEGETVPIGQVVGTIDTDTGTLEKETGEQSSPAAKGQKDAIAEDVPQTQQKVTIVTEEKPQTPSEKIHPPFEERPLLPSVRRLVAEKGIKIENIRGTGPNGLITRGDVILYLESLSPEILKKNQAKPEPAASEKKEPGQQPHGEESITRKAMTPIRKRIAAHLLAAKQNTAMLTTFNEIDMCQVTDLRNAFKDTFEKKNKVRLGFMSFFIKAVVSALKECPEINAKIVGDDIIYHHYFHIGVAIGGEKGLVVPVIRHADQKSFADLESEIIEFVKKIKTNRLTLADMEGGTFSITNGGVYGSLLSTPILNMPQSGILGMHKVEKRPVVVNDDIVIRPMMYVALSYDHRIVDGQSAVVFLRRIKEFIENPARIMMEI